MSKISNIYDYIRKNIVIDVDKQVMLVRSENLNSYHLYTDLLIPNNLGKYSINKLYGTKQQQM